MRNKILTRVETFFLLVRPRALPNHNVGPRWERSPVQIGQLFLMHRGSFQAEQWELWRQVELWLVLWVSSELARPLNHRTIAALQICRVDGIFLFSSFFLEARRHHDEEMPESREEGEAEKRQHIHDSKPHTVDRLEAPIRCEWCGTAVRDRWEYTSTHKQSKARLLALGPSRVRSESVWKRASWRVVTIFIYSLVFFSSLVVS